LWSAPRRQRLGISPTENIYDEPSTEVVREIGQQTDALLRIPTAPVFRLLLEPVRYKGAYGGRGSGKSH
jgi:hypothetical protein